MSDELDAAREKMRVAMARVELAHEALVEATRRAEREQLAAAAAIDEMHALLVMTQPSLGDA